MKTTHKLVRKIPEPFLKIAEIAERKGYGTLEWKRDDIGDVVGEVTIDDETNEIEVDAPGVELPREFWMDGWVVQMYRPSDRGPQRVRPGDPAYVGKSIAFLARMFHLSLDPPYISAYTKWWLEEGRESLAAEFGTPPELPRAPPTGPAGAKVVAAEATNAQEREIRKICHKQGLTCSGGDFGTYSKLFEYPSGRRWVPYILFECPVHGVQERPVAAFVGETSKTPGCVRCGRRGGSVEEDVVRKIFEYLFDGKPFPPAYPPWLVNPATGRTLEFDGYNRELRLAFEYNGPHHARSLDEDTLKLYAGDWDGYTGRIYRDNFKVHAAESLRVRNFDLTPQQEELWPNFAREVTLIDVDRKRELGGVPPGELYPRVYEYVVRRVSERRPDLAEAYNLSQKLDNPPDFSALEERVKESRAVPARKARKASRGRQEGKKGQTSRRSSK
ncbi:MAG: hypothetical protein ACTSU5_14775 [Promethearchaeota archaeon]